MLLRRVGAWAHGSALREPLVWPFALPTALVGMLLHFLTVYVTPPVARAAAWCEARPPVLLLVLLLATWFCAQLVAVLL